MDLPRRRRRWFGHEGRGHRPSLLIVDDEGDIRAVVRATLEDEGFDDIWEASDGETAIEVLYRHQPDVVVLDYSMPGMDGEAVAKSIRLLSPRSHVVVFTGAVSAPPDWALECDAFLVKTQIDRLAPVVRALLTTGR